MSARVRTAAHLTEPAWVRWLLIGVGVMFLGLLLLLPVALIFQEALRKGWALYLKALRDPATMAAIKLTLTTAAIVVPLNTLFGLTAAWAIARFHFRGKNVLTTLVDLPFAVSPVIAGMVFVLLFGKRGYLGPWLASHDVKIIFALPGFVLATSFVSLPFVARELIAFMQAQGKDDEEAALTLGASAWQMFWRVTLPNIKWGLLYGVILCNARAMGEFGAVSVVSSHIRGETMTLPLQIQSLYEDQNFVAAFALSSLMVWLAMITLIIKRIVEWRAERALEGGRA